MANNVGIGQTIITAKVTVNIADTGINAGNTLIIYSFEPGLSKSYIPGRVYNPLSQFTEGESYLIRATAAMDLTDYAYPPYPSGSDGNTFITEDGTPLIPE